MTKLRLDELLVIKNLAPTRSQAKLLIKEGKITVNGELITKSSRSFDANAKIESNTTEQYVSRGAQKLKTAIQKFQISPQNLTVSDVGASTGGFTDYLLQNGASKVYAIDVGTAQLSPKLLQDPRVINLENTDIRKLTELPEKPDLAVVDLSYISLTLTLPSIAALIKPQAPIIALLKPQFEAGKQRVPKDGVIKDPETIKAVLQEFKDWCSSNNFEVSKITPSETKGKKGNQEYLCLLKSLLN